jgi:hypothetical protein
MGSFLRRHYTRFAATRSLERNPMFVALLSVMGREAMTVVPIASDIAGKCTHL